MANHFFRFKQFTVWHDKCAMKVGTDGVLLGAWADPLPAQTILDVGTGTGLVALMLAQRCGAEIMAVDINSDAVAQAQENINKSPWTERVSVLYTDYKDYTPLIKFDLIVSNPPFFTDSLKSPDTKRNLARHTDELSYNDLMQKTASLLSSEGCFSVIIPTDVLRMVIEIAFRYRLFPVKQTFVYTKPGVSSKRTLLTFGWNQTECLIDELTIELSRHVYSDEFHDLTKDYYLDR